MEGGYQNRPDDNGNWACGELIGTKYGVSAVAFQTWVGRCPTASEIQSLDESQAWNFYAWYFNRYNLYHIENQSFFELLANNTMGSPGGAARAEQRALNRLGYSVPVDGVRGPQTLGALNAAWAQNPQSIYNAVREEWIKHLQSLNKPQFLQGWLYRMDTFFPPIGAGVIAGVSLLLLFAAFLILKK